MSRNISERLDLSSVEEYIDQNLENVEKFQCNIEDNILKFCIDLPIYEIDSPEELINFIENEYNAKFQTITSTKGVNCIRFHLYD